MSLVRRYRIQYLGSPLPVYCTLYKSVRIYSFAQATAISQGTSATAYVHRSQYRVRITAILKPPEFVHTRSPGLSNAQLSVLRHTAVESHLAAALRGQGACSCAQSCTQEQRDVCAEHHTHGEHAIPCTYAARAQQHWPRLIRVHPPSTSRRRTGACPSAASHDATLLAGLVDVGAHDSRSWSSTSKSIEESPSVTTRGRPAAVS